MTVQPDYVRNAMRGLTPKQRQLVADGCLHGDFTMATVRALLRRNLFFVQPTSPNGRCGPAVLTPLGKTVQSLLRPDAPAVDGGGERL